MVPYLEELAQRMIAEYPRLENLTMVFPNQRAALFFRGYLARHLTKPAWSPRLITIESLFHDLSDLQEADKLGLVFRLYGVYQKLINKEESFDRFYFWGEMLLRDFDEVDKYLVDAALLFKDLSKLKELDASFDYLNEEQKRFLMDFWLKFGDKPSGSKEEFLKVWRQLPLVYTTFVKQLRKEKLGYEGMIQRDVADRIRDKKLDGEIAKLRPSDIVFSGFNALTHAEETLISQFVSDGARIFWDTDTYYIEDEKQEAGQFFRQYKKHPILGSSLKESPSNFCKSPKTIEFFGVPQKIGQAKLAGQLIETEIIPSLQTVLTQAEEIRTVIVLPDESMLLPVMHSLPAGLESVNVTMGFPLRNTPMYNLLELLLELQINRRGESFSHRQVTAILGHAYIHSDDNADTSALIFEIIRNNRVYIPAGELKKLKGIVEEIFKAIEASEITGYLLGIVQWLGARFEDRQSFDREYAFHFHRHLSRLHEVLKETGSLVDMKGFQKLFRQFIQSQKIPFTGEPLKGLQIMGVLETRSLDFDNVIILSLNEGSLPAAPKQGSYIPHAIRKAYGLPTFDHQDATYAYLFYRTLQRAKTIRLFYNTEPDVLGMGEMSRFLQQLTYESNLKIDHRVLTNPIQRKETLPIDVAKTAEVMAALNAFTNPSGRGISPSALNDYVECSLRFYLKYIAGFREAEEVEEDLDARIFGTFLHQVMDWFYKDLLEGKASGLIEPSDLDARKVESMLDELIDRAFREHYNEEAIDYRGQRIVVKEIVKQFARRIIDIDRDHAPFTIEMLEEKKFNAPITITANGLKTSVILGGRIDRVDSKGFQTRIIDYKTGKDEPSFDSIASLFARTGKRNKAAFQTLLYSWLYNQNRKSLNALVPMLMNRVDLFKDDELKSFSMNREKIADVRPLFPEFEDKLRKLLEELYNPAVNFTQTVEEANCKYCLFKGMCRR